MTANPYSKKLGADYETILTVSMLLGMPQPIICSCCLGEGRDRMAFGLTWECGQCKGSGYDYIDGATYNHFIERNQRPPIFGPQYGEQK